MGAPLFMARRPNGQRSELGRLYLYLGRGQEPLSGPPQTLTGTHPYGRFSAAIASLGDLDRDGFGGNSGDGDGDPDPAIPRGRSRQGAHVPSVPRRGRGRSSGR